MNLSPGAEPLPPPPPTGAPGEDPLSPEPDMAMQGMMQGAVQGASAFPSLDPDFVAQALMGILQQQQADGAAFAAQQQQLVQQNPIMQALMGGSDGGGVALSADPAMGDPETTVGF